MAQAPRLDPKLLRDLFAAGEQIWDGFLERCGELYHPFVPADYAAAHEALRGLRPRADTFLELGSGNGVITILADLLGYQAYGIELDDWLTDAARDLAESHGSSATFAQGSFVPEDFERSELQCADFPTVTGDGLPAYAELGMQLDDFDLIYLFPWPDEQDFHHEMIRQRARPDVLFLSYGATEGFELSDL